MPGALAALHRLGVDPPGAPIVGITYRDERHAVSTEFRRGPGRGVRRTILHDQLRAAVDSAGVPVLQHTVSDVRQDDNGVAAGGIRARYLVGADGLHSTVRRLAGLGSPAPRQAARYGLRRHFAITPWTDHVEVWWGPSSEAYLTPVDRETLGVAFLSTRRASYDDQLADAPGAGRATAGRPPADAGTRRRAASPTVSARRSRPGAARRRRGRIRRRAHRRGHRHIASRCRRAGQLPGRGPASRLRRGVAASVAAISAAHSHAAAGPAAAHRPADDHSAGRTDAEAVRRGCRSAGAVSVVRGRTGGPQRSR